MAASRVQLNSNMAVLLQKEGISAESIEALLRSSSSLGEFHDSRSVMKFEDVCTNASGHSYLHSCEVDGDEEMEGYLHQKKRRLAAKQVQFLERSFEVENKLDPDRKIQLARELDLQPRQVAIWFQNRRARWKTKQLEKDFDALKANYGSLMDEYEKLVKEKDKLQSEVTHLTNKLLLKERSKDGVRPEGSISPEPRPEPPKILEAPDAAPLLSSLKQEDPNSNNSVVLDAEGSPCCNEEVGCPAVPDATASDLPHADRVEEVHGYHFLHLVENSGDFGFPDQAFLLWPF